MTKAIGEHFGNGLVGEFKCGVEIELEAFPDHEPYKYWKAIEDGSLRNNGRELVSIPLKVKNLGKAFTEIAADIAKAEPNARCGVHVHMSVEDFTLEDYKKALLLYYVYEPLIFLVSGERKDNSFCVPLGGSAIQDLFPHLMTHVSSMDDLYYFTRSYGKKYYALNIIPSTSLCTLEFRHHQASNNGEEILSFIKLINNIYDLIMGKYSALSSQQMVDTLCLSNNISNYEELTKELLTDTNYELSPLSPVVRSLLRSSVFNLRVLFNRLGGI